MRVQESSPLDPSWQLLDQNEHGLIVEGNGAGDADVPKNKLQEPDDTQQTSELTQKEGEGGRGKEANDEPEKDKIKCDIGERVKHQKYGYGVVRWVGEVGGEKMTGIELVGTHHSPRQYILYISLYRKTTELVVGMGVCQAQVNLSSLAVKVTEFSAPSLSYLQTPELQTLHWRQGRRPQHQPADPASCLRRVQWWR